MIEIFCRLLLVFLLAFMIGKIASALKMPSVLGFLIAGMIFGPHAINILNQDILDAPLYQNIISLLECCMGMMLGSEMIWQKMKTYGSKIFIITVFQSLMTFFVVLAAFALVFYIVDIPVFLSLIFGGIALATAPAPAFSIIKEYKTDGPVTRTLIPLAVIDDIIAICVFLFVMTMVLHHTSGGSLPGYIVLAVITIPAIIGIFIGYVFSKMVTRIKSELWSYRLIILGTVITYAITLFVNEYIMPYPILNYMMSGMFYSATFANMLPENTLNQIMHFCSPLISLCFTLIILNLGAPLDYHLIFHAGIYTVIYILFRAIGKISGARLGATISHAEMTVKKYLGFTLLPHSGVSLVLTGIAISALTGDFYQYGNIIRGTIAAAAVINEIIAVFIARKGFELADEIGKSTSI